MRQIIVGAALLAGAAASLPAQLMTVGFGARDAWANTLHPRGLAAQVLRGVTRS